MTQFKIPPNSVEAEMALLSAMVECNRLINDIDYLKSEDFYRAENQIIYTRLQALAMLGKPVDIVTLFDALTEAGEIDKAGGMDYIANLMANSRGPANAAHYAEIIRDRAISRKLIQAGYSVAEIGYSAGDVQERIDKAQSVVMQLEPKESSDPVHINDILRYTIAGIDKRFRHDGDIVGLATGFDELDKKTSGLGDGDMIVIAGRPSMGKTTFAMNIAENVAMNDKFVIVYNLEMTSEALNLRNLASIGGIFHDRVRSGKLEDEDWPKLTLATSRLKDKCIYIDDDSSITSTQLLSRSRKIASKVGRKVDLVVIDYMQLLNDEGEGTERITRISRKVKLTAKALKCPVIVLSQLNRGVENRPLNDRRPRMSDLRESGAIEQDADIIIFVYRDEVYNDNTDRKGIGEAIIAKQRNGPLGTVYLKAEMHYIRFRSNPGYTPPQDYKQSPISKRGGGFS